MAHRRAQPKCWSFRPMGAGGGDFALADPRLDWPVFGRDSPSSPAFADTGLLALGLPSGPIRRADIDRERRISIVASLREIRVVAALLSPGLAARCGSWALRRCRHAVSSMLPGKERSRSDRT
jgi:hypothetical protein